MIELDPPAASEHPGTPRRVNARLAILLAGIALGAAGTLLAMGLLGFNSPRQALDLRNDLPGDVHLGLGTDRLWGGQSVHLKPGGTGHFLYAPGDTLEVFDGSEGAPIRFQLEPRPARAVLAADPSGKLELRRVGE
jgi:hypothetical protein